MAKQTKAAAKAATGIKPGDKVAWNTTQGPTEGTVERKVTNKTSVKGYTAAATKDDPQFVVKSAKSGKTAIHKPASLKKK